MILIRENLVFSFLWITLVVTRHFGEGGMYCTNTQNHDMNLVLLRLNGSIHVLQVSPPDYKLLSLFTERKKETNMSGGDVVCSGWLRKSPPEKKLRRYVSAVVFILKKIVKRVTKIHTLSGRYG